MQRFFYKIIKNPISSDWIWYVIVRSFIWLMKASKSNNLNIMVRYSSAFLMYGVSACKKHYSMANNMDLRKYVKCSQIKFSVPRWQSLVIICTGTFWSGPASQIGLDISGSQEQRQLKETDAMVWKIKKPEKREVKEQRYRNWNHTAIGIKNAK